jgi:hypothetical protein
MTRSIGPLSARLVALSLSAAAVTGFVAGGVVMANGSTGAPGPSPTASTGAPKSPDSSSDKPTTDSGDVTPSAATSAQTSRQTSTQTSSDKPKTQDDGTREPSDSSTPVRTPTASTSETGSGATTPPATTASAQPTGPAQPSAPVASPSPANNTADPADRAPNSEAPASG